MSEREQVPIRELEERFRRLSELLYDTTVPPQRLDEEVLPYLAESVRFIDPWQQASGREKYRLGAAGFHCMFSFDLDIFQVNVQLDDTGRRGRAMVDSVMNLKQVEWLYTYPLRTLLVYHFVLTDPGAGGEVRFLIHTHEEMWSFGDMIEALPLVGWLYKNVFRKGFSYGFLAASYLCCRRRRRAPQGA
jgi:hypothetical protein